MLSGRGLCDELTTRPEESYRPWCVVEYDLETSRIGAPYIYDISNLRVKILQWKSFYKMLWLKGVVKTNKDSNSQCKKCNVFH